jgi:hypothetical protein
MELAGAAAVYFGNPASLLHRELLRAGRLPASPIGALREKQQRE